MTEPGHLPRFYGETEIGRILKRATELQHHEPSGPATGVTLAELEEIATEAGIDPTYLRRAAMELDSGLGQPTLWRKFLGEELLLTRELTLPGELAESGFERIVEAIQAQSHEHGQPSLLGRTLTWRAETPGKTRTIQIVVTSRDGVTQIRLEESLAQFAVGLFSGMTVGGGVGIGVGAGLPIGLKVLGSVLFAVAAPIGVVGLSFLIARGIYGEVVAHRRRRISELFDRVVDEAVASIAAAAEAGDQQVLDGGARGALGAGSE